MATREGRWNCPQCTTAQLGRHQECQGCGAPRPANVKFYLPENAPEVTDQQLLQRANLGPDWPCHHCDSLNPANKTECERCGAERSKPATIQHIVETRGSVQLPTNTTKNSLLERHLVRNHKTTDIRTASQPILPKRDDTPKLLAIAGVGLTALALLIYWLVAPYDVDMTVTDMQWTRDIHIDILKTIKEEDWSIPSGGRQIDSWRAIHHYDKVLDHYDTKTRQVSERVQTGTERVRTGSRDNGNGFFEDTYSDRPVYETRYHTETYQEPVYRDEPRYATKYSYNIERWKHNRTVHAEGKTRAAKWPEFVLVKGSSPYNVGAERERSREDRYLIVLTMKNKKGESEAFNKFVSEIEWRKYEVTQPVVARMNHLGMVLSFRPK